MPRLMFCSNCDRRVKRALPLVAGFAAAALGGLADARPLDVSREACLQRLLRPGARPDLVTMICDAQVYLTPEQRAAAAERSRNNIEASISRDVAMEQEFRQWLRTFPRGTRQEWEAFRQKERQARMEQQGAEYRARLEAEQNEARRVDLQRLEREMAQRQLEEHCRNLNQDRRSLYVNGKQVPHEGRSSTAYLPPQCWGLR